MFLVNAWLLFGGVYVMSVVWGLIHSYLIYKHKLEPELELFTNTILSFIPLINLVIDDKWEKLVYAHNSDNHYYIRRGKSPKNPDIDPRVLRHLNLDPEYLYLLPVVLLIITFFI